MPRHHVQHTQNVGPILFVFNENIALVMPCVTARAVTSCMHRAAHAYGCAIRAGRTIFIKNNHLTF